ncbi:MAG TPA: mycothione reductase [Ilumatobacter sp.]|nr:mycothione reductase [Ilumatobacter sp.]
MTSPEQYDLIVVGSGSGNSIPEYLAGWRVALVERDLVFGGTCLNRGCIPSKMFVLPADLVADAATSARLGVDVRFHGADWAAIRDRVFGRIDAISQGGREYRATGTAGLTLIEGTARFSGDRQLDVELADGTVRTIAAPNIFVAVGSRPVVPDIPGLAESGFHTSDSIMRLDRLPARLGVIGAGFIAAEMGHVFASFGSQVTVFNRSMGMLTHHDFDISARFTEVFGEHVDLRLGRVPEWVERRQGGNGAEIVLHDPRVEPVVVDELLVATGRRPNSDLIDAAAGGVAIAADGTIDVDAQMRTSAPGVWAAGDVANRWQLKHVANAEARVAFWNIAHPDDLRTVDYSAVPSAVFSHPQVAAVGFTEQDALAAGLDIVVGCRDYGGTAYGWALVDETSFAKVIVDRSSGLIVGAHVLGPQAATLIQPLVTAIQFGQTADQVARGQYWIHPALTEVVENALIDALDRF